MYRHSFHCRFAVCNTISIEVTGKQVYHGSSEQSPLGPGGEHCTINLLNSVDLALKWHMYLPFKRHCLFSPPTPSTLVAVLSLMYPHSLCISCPFDSCMSMLRYSIVLAIAVLATFSQSIRYDPERVDWNLNQNVTAIAPLDYWGEWENHSK